MKRALVMAALLTGCAPREPPRDLQTEMHAAKLEAEVARFESDDAYRDRYPTVGASDQADCRDISKRVSGGNLAQHSNREVCLSERQSRNEIRSGEKKQEEYHKTHITTYVYGGTLVRDVNDGMFLTYYPSGGGRGVSVRPSALEREKVRCEAKVQMSYVNDALDTRQELFDRCMDLQLSLLR